MLFALFDIPWTPLFIFAIFTFHPMLGWLAVGGGLLLVAISLANQMMTRRSTAEATATAMVSDGSPRRCASRRRWCRASACGRR